MMVPASTAEQDPVPSLDDQDESVRIAVKALGDMRNSRPQPSSSNCIQPRSSPLILEASSSTSSISPTHLADDANSVDFVARVSTIPLVNTALRAYEQTKASSKVVKYGAEMMESSVKTISRPVIGRLPVTQLDEFACRQLDRFGRYGGNTSRTPIQEEREDKTAPTTPERESGPRSSPEWERSSGHTPTPGPEARQHAVVQRSRWQAMLLEAGGLGAAVSEESMRRLQYCLQWLQYATNHIDAQILVLRDFMASLQAAATRSGETVSQHHMRTLNDVKRDVIDTIRQVVDIVSKYAGGALPEPARQRVRGFILHLPQRWASASRQGPEPTQPYSTGTGKRRSGRYAYGTAEGSSASNPYPTPISLSRPGSPTHSRNTSIASRAALHTRSTQNMAGSSTMASHGMSAIAANQAAQRILTLATESLDMIRGVTGVFRESLDRADAWVERLKVVGIQRQNSDTLAMESRPGSPSMSASDTNSVPTSPSVLSSGGSSHLPPLHFSRSSSGFYSSYPPSPFEATSPSTQMGMLSLASTVTTPRSVAGPLPMDEDEDVEDLENDKAKEFGAGAEVWSRSKSPMEMDTDG